MNLLILIQSFIPGDKYDEYMPIVRETVAAVRRQVLPAGCTIHVVLSDDGSPYLGPRGSGDLRILSPEETAAVRKEHKLDVDDIVRNESPGGFRKADLYNHYIRTRGDAFDVFFFLDDDHTFFDERSLARVVAHVENGFNFVVGRLCNRNLYFRSYLDNHVQGTTFAMSRDLFLLINGFSEHVRSWGCGFDADLFWRLYESSLKGAVKAVYDGNIITQDKLSRRWSGHAGAGGGVKGFRESFRQIHAVDPFDNPSRKKTAWMRQAQDEKVIPERYYRCIRLPEYLVYVSQRGFSWPIRWAWRALLSGIRWRWVVMTQGFVNAQQADAK